MEQARWIVQYRLPRGGWRVLCDYDGEASSWSRWSEAQQAANLITHQRGYRTRVVLPEGSVNDGEG
jgi:hypothetical protein